MENIFETIENIYAHGGEAVLVTLCETKGSTPRKAGAKMLVYNNGQIIGTIGGGSLEHEAIKKALELFKTKKPVLWERSLWDLGMVCGGTGVLYFEYLSKEC